MEAARVLDYSPNLLVHSLQQGRTGIISFYNAFRHRLFNDLYMDQLSTAVEHAAGDLGLDVLVHCDFDRTAEDTYRRLNGGRSDGVLFFAPLPDDPLLPWLRTSRLPVVLIGSRDPMGVIPSVRDDVVGGMRAVAESLAGLGHQRIAILKEVGGDFRDADERSMLLLPFLAERGVRLPPDSVITQTKTLKAHLEELLSKPEPPTAIFCWRDWLAYAVLEACDEIGVAVPQQLSIVGYDGLHWPAKTSHTAASVRVDLLKLAEAAVSLLDSCVRGQRVETVELSVPVEFIHGTTLGPAPSLS
jgi:DNA-binding LacI/PurR family transcriptional regulator